MYLGRHFAAQIFCTLIILLERFNVKHPMNYRFIHNQLICMDYFHFMVSQVYVMSLNPKAMFRYQGMSAWKESS
jgi:hypothetical protein